MATAVGGMHPTGMHSCFVIEILEYMIQISIQRSGILFNLNNIKFYVEALSRSLWLIGGSRFPKSGCQSKMWDVILTNINQFS